MEKPTPLNIPEILSRIISFVPAWEKHEWMNDVKFSPCPLLSCALVSKSWRETALPHLWRVYSTDHMHMVPIQVLAQSSPLFRYFDLRRKHSDEPYRHVPQELWQRDASGQLLLRCIALRSFCVTPGSLSEQFELLRANRNLVSLDWLSFESSEHPESIQAVAKPFASSLKNLRLVEGSLTIQSLLSVLACFPNLERFDVGAAYKPLFCSRAPELKGTAGIRIESLKHLEVIENVGKRHGLRALLSMFRHCPRIKHVVVNGYTSNFNEHQPTFAPLAPIHEMVLAWRSQQLVACDTSATLEPTSSAALGTGYLSSQETDLGVDKLDIHLSANIDSKIWINAYFDNGCHDLVRFSAEIRFYNPDVMLPLLFSHKNKLRGVHIGYGSILGDDMEALAPFLGSLTELRSFGFSTRDGVTKKNTFALFRGELPKYDQSTGSMLKTAELNTDATTDWVCQRLESLTIDGMWGISHDEFYDENEGQSDGLETVVLPAASENHQWVANDVAFDMKLKKAVADRIKSLPALRELTLNDVCFAYTKICASIVTSA